MITLLFALVTTAQASTAPLVVSQQACFPLPAMVNPVKVPPGFCQPQKAAKGSIVQIQMQGDPSRWTVLGMVGPAVQRPANPPFYNSPLRIPGVNKVFIFEFQITGDGPVRIVMKESPPFLTDKKIGSFTFTFNN